MKNKNNFLDLLLLFNILISSIMIIFIAPSEKLDLSGQFRPNEEVGYFHNQQAIVSPIYAPGTSILGESTEPKKIYIDLTNQRLYAFEGNRLVYNFLVSTGKWGRTPTGVFNIWIKLRYTKMEGGSKALNTYYYLPNVPYVMYFYNNLTPKYRGFGIHGTYWHNNFGHPMSHGCINMRTEEVAELYYWADPKLNGRQSIYASKNNPGTQVVIFGKAPN